MGIKQKSMIVVALLAAIVAGQRLDPAPGRSPGPPPPPTTPTSKFESPCSKSKYIRDGESIVAAPPPLLNSDDTTTKRRLRLLALDVIHDVFNTTNEPLVPELIYKGKCM